MQASPGALLPAVPEATPTAEDAVLATLMVLGRRMRQRLPQDTVDFSLVPILKTLHNSGPMRLSLLAERLELDASTISRHVRQLEDRGFLRRTGDPEDGRASRVDLTDTGHAVLADHIQRRRLLVTDALAGFDEGDREQLRNLLERLNARILTP